MKKSKATSNTGSPDEIEEDEEDEEEPSTSSSETRRQTLPALQVCRYLLEMFSVPLLRSHATVGLVDRDRLQLYHANRSVILVSSAINFKNGDGLDKFIAAIIAFRLLPSRENGILDSLVPSNIELAKNPKIPMDRILVQDGKKLQLPRSGNDDPMMITLGEVISREPSIIGRSTTVLKASCDQLPGKSLVVKISWPGSKRIAEDEFLRRAIKEAKRTDWALKHLPRVYYTRTVDLNEHPTFKSVADLLEGAEFGEKKFKYERRVLRIIVQEELYPLRSLTSARHLGQVFVDIACSK